MTKLTSNSFWEKTITVEGKAINTKLGARLYGENKFIWVDNLSSWPKGYYLGQGKGKLLTVTGVVIEKYDLPVSIYQENLFVATLQFPPGTDLKKASHRFLLKDAKWKVKK